MRLFVFTAAFPFFNNVDEHYHFDLVCRYSHADVPRGLEPCSAEAAALIALYASPEYVRTPREFPAMKMIPPVWSRPAEERDEAFRQRRERWLREVNHEAVQPPFYYAVAGLWYDLGKLLGFEGGKLLYWTRFLNIPAYVLLVWLSYGLAKELVPASRFVYLGVPFVLVFLPQDIFYGLNNDVLSAPLVTLSLYLLLRMYRIETPRWGLALCAGLATAAAILTKFTNAPVLAIFAAVVFLKLGLPWWRKQPLAHLVPVLLLLAASVIPIGCWMARNYLVFGDLTGFALRSRFMGWTPKSIGEYWHHPIFTPGGWLEFWRGLTTTLWRGEFLWHRVFLTIGPIDEFYFLSSTLLLLSFIVASLRGGRRAPAATRSAAMVCLPLFVLSVAMLILFSISYDFGTGPFNYPSRESPYFTQGRLILGALVPFLIMYLSGLESLLDGLRLSFLRWPLLILLVDLVAITQMICRWTYSPARIIGIICPNVLSAIAPVPRSIVPKQRVALARAAAS